LLAPPPPEPYKDFLATNEEKMWLVKRRLPEGKRRGGGAVCAPGGGDYDSTVPRGPVSARVRGAG